MSRRFKAVFIFTKNPKIFTITTVLIFTLSLILPSSGLLLPNGKCVPKCFIPLDVDMKCGSNGVTYQNIEELQCAKELCFSDLSLAYNGKCGQGNQKDSKAIVQHDDCKSKSATNSIFPTRPNRNNSRDKSASVDPDPTSIYFKHHDDEIRSQEPAVKKNLRALPKKSKHWSGDGQQIPKNKDCNADDCVCDYTLSPMCGSNGFTYGNTCLLECVQKCDPELSYHHSGFCGKIFFSTEEIPFFRVLSPDNQSF